MGYILDDGMKPEKAAKIWLKDNPSVLDQWLDGVKTREGEDGLPAAKTSLGL